MPSDRKKPARGKRVLASGPRAELARAMARVGALERRLALLSDTVQAASSLLDPRMVSRFIMERAAGLVGGRWWRLYRLDEAAGVLLLDARDAMSLRDPAPQLPIGTGFAGWLVGHRHPEKVVDPAQDARLDRTLEWPDLPGGELVGIPLVSRGRVIGVAELAAAPGRSFGPEDVGLLTTLMEPAAIALDNSLLFRKLEERTVTDDLTHLYNARFMETYLRRETKRAVRYGHPVALLFLDLDGFKQVNDCHGHMAGSRTLVEVGELLRSTVRDIDVVARWGGDEFGVVLPETNAAGALISAERIRALIEERVYLQGFGLACRISVSIGVASCPEHGHTPEALLAAADTAMYAVKYSGKNGVKLAEIADPVLVP